MNTILVPTDFSATAFNAAQYAVQLSGQLRAQRIVLYHSYEIPVSIDPIIPGIQMLDLDTLKNESARELEHFRRKLLTSANNIILETINEYGALSAGLDDVCKSTQADLVVMGITGGGKLEEKFIGSNAVSVAKHTKVPVLIVPHDAPFAHIGKVLLTSDYDKADKNIPVQLVKKIVSAAGSKLFVFNIREDAGDKDEHFSLHTLLRELHPVFHFSENKDYVDAVNGYVAANNIDMIITIPKHHGFFGSLFAESHTKKLAFHSKVPVMVIHE